MASRFHSDETSIFIEYCRSCETHSWCTHHDESKYHDTFLKCTSFFMQLARWSVEDSLSWRS